VGEMSIAQLVDELRQCINRLARALDDTVAIHHLDAAFDAVEDAPTQNVDLSPVDEASRSTADFAEATRILDQLAGMDGAPKGQLIECRHAIHTAQDRWRDVLTSRGASS
jgi:hypothetical protein